MTKAQMIKWVDNRKDEKISSTKDRHEKQINDFKEKHIHNLPLYHEMKAAYSHFENVADRFIEGIPDENRSKFGSGLAEMQRISAECTFDQALIRSIEWTEDRNRYRQYIGDLGKLYSKHSNEIQKIRDEYRKITGYLNNAAVTAKTAQAYLESLGFAVPQKEVPPQLPMQPVDVSILF